MGYYVNPPNQTKEQFLTQKGKRLPRAPKWSDVPKGSLPVVFIDNGRFSAAAIACSEAELKEFSRNDDPHPSIFYMVPIAELVKVSDHDFARHFENVAA